jgi:hypothetical protein
MPAQQGSATAGQCHAPPARGVGLQRFTLATLLAAAVAAAFALVSTTAGAFSEGTLSAATWSAAPDFPLRYWLKTDGAGDRVSATSLPLARSAPDAAGLANYDIDRDSFPGLLLAKGGVSGLDPTAWDPTKHQAWDLAVASPTALSGGLRLTVWAAVKDFNDHKRGALTAGVYECSVGQCTMLAVADLDASAWVLGDTFAARSVDLTLAETTLVIGSTLRVVLSVSPASEDDLWFAYDTRAYPSLLEVIAE